MILAELLKDNSKVIPEPSDLCRFLKYYDMYMMCLEISSCIGTMVRHLVEMRAFIWSI